MFDAKKLIHRRFRVISFAAFALLFLAISSLILHTHSISLFGVNFEHGLVLILIIAAAPLLVLWTLLLSKEFLCDQFERKKLEIIFQNSPLGVCTVNQDGIIDSCNPKMVELAGAESSREVIGLNALELPTYRDVGLDKLIKKGLAGESFSKEWRYVSYTGKKESWWKYYAQPIYDESGRVAQLLLVVADITEHKELERKVQEYSGQLEEKVNERTKDLDNAKKALLNILEDIKERDVQLEQEKQKLQVTLESIGDGAFTLSPERKIIFFNKVAEELSGYSRKEVFGKEYRDVLKFVMEKDRRENFSFIEEVFKTGGIRHITNHTLLISKSGKEIPILDSAAPIKDSGGKVLGVIVVFRDITKERAIEKAQSEFISLSSHQLRTPLTNIKWAGDMFLKGDLGKLTNQQKEFMSDLYQSANRMAELITALLSIARIESAQLRINSETIDPKKLYQDVFKDLRALSLAKRHIITFKESEDLPKFKSDPQLLFEIFKNLLSNAIKYTPNGGKIEASFSAKDGDVFIYVKDNGFGIPKHQQDRAFQKFFRADNAIKMSNDGTGLGLYIVRNLVELLGGKIWFESEENKGTTFYFTLPIKK